MRRGLRWAASVGSLVAILILVGAPLASAGRSIPQATHARSPRSAPLSPDFVLWQAMSGLEPVLQNASPHGLGLRPSPTRGFVATGPVPAPGIVTSYPASYDLRTQGKLTAVRNQGAFGTCWTFAALGSLESSSLPGETLDLAEDNVVLTSGFDIGGASTAAAKYAAGGNVDMATAYLARWGGPVYQTDDAYGDSATPADLTARRHVQDIDYYAGRTSATDNDRIKYAVSAYGGAYVSMCWDDASYNGTTKAHYYTGSAGTNHAVVVVGWNDDYAATSFLTTAPGNGAFIVRNSWGSGWGENGYFYVSYYDTRFARQYTSGGNTYANPAATFEAAQATTNYGTVYQHDPLGAVSEMGYGAGVATWGANVFTASSASVLNAVGFYANAPNTAYEVWAGPSTASLTRLTSGTLTQMGYHTVNVPTGTNMASGATFVVAVKLTTPGYAWPLSVEYPVADYSSAATATAGQSYYSSNGTAWNDLTGYRANANACIKAYASRIPTSSSAYGFATNGTSGWKTTAQTVTITASGGDGTGRTIYYSQDGGVDVEHVHRLQRGRPGEHAGRAPRRVLRQRLAGRRGDPRRRLRQHRHRQAVHHRRPPERHADRSGDGHALTERCHVRRRQDRVQGRRRRDVHDRHLRRARRRHAHGRLPLHRRRGQRREPDKTFTRDGRRARRRRPADLLPSAASPRTPTSGWQTSAQSVTVTASGGERHRPHDPLQPGRRRHVDGRGRRQRRPSPSAARAPITSSTTRRTPWRPRACTTRAGVNVDSVAPVDVRRPS